MARTEIDGDQIKDSSVQRKDLDTTSVGQSVITRLLNGTAGLSIDWTGADEGTGDVTLSLDAGNFGTSFYTFEKEGEETTTFDGWVEYALFTTPTLPTGIYLIHFSGGITNSSKKRTGLQYSWRLDGTTAFAPIYESFNSPTTADVYESRTAFKIITVAQSGTVSIQTSYGQTTAGGTAKMNLSDVYLFKAADLP